VLVVVEHRDVQALPQPVLDLETRRGGDVLQVDPTEDRGDALDGLDDLLGAVHVQADREGVDAGELLEEQGLALHHRQGGLRADVAEAEHGGAVTDDGHGVALDGEVVDPGRLPLDGQADAGHPGRVGHRQVVAVADLAQGQHLDLAAVVEGERAVLPLDQFHAVEAPDGLEDLLLVGLVDAVDDDLVVEHLALHLEALEAPDVGPGVTDGGGEAAEGARHVVQQHPQAHGVGRGR